MTNKITQFVERVTQWPRAMQWAFWATVATFAFLVWDSTIATVGADWASQVHAMKTKLPNSRSQQQ